MPSNARKALNNIKLIVDDFDTIAGPVYMYGRPAKPTIISPLNNTTTATESVVLSPYAHPSGVNQCSLQVQRSFNTDFTDLAEPSLITSLVSNTHIFVNPSGSNNLYIRARYIDIFGTSSLWSDTIYCTVVTRPSLRTIVRAGVNTSAVRTYELTESKTGDLLVAAFAHTGTLNVPAGWTLYKNQLNVLGSSEFKMYYRVATADGESHNWNDSSNHDGIIAAFTNTSGIGAESIVSMNGGVSSTTLTLPAGGAGLPVFYMGFCRSPSNVTFPAGWTKVYGDVTESGSGYFTPIFGYQTEAVAGTMSRSATGYAMYGASLLFND